MVDAGLIKTSAFIKALLPGPERGMVTADNASLFILFAVSALLILAEGSWLALALDAITHVVRHMTSCERAVFLRAGEEALGKIDLENTALRNDVSTVMLPSKMQRYKSYCQYYALFIVMKGIGVVIS